MTRRERLKDDATWAAYAAVGAAAYVGIAVLLVGIGAALWLEERFWR